jgi:hypothetical protein
VDGRDKPGHDGEIHSQRDIRSATKRRATLGGSSSINGMPYICGNQRDYHALRQRGCTVGAIRSRISN